MMYLLLYSFLFTVYFSVIRSHKVIFSFISVSSFSCVQRLVSKMELVKTLLHSQLKETNLENWPHILTESPKEGFHDIAFQHIVDESKHCNPDMQMNLKLVPVFLCLYGIYLVVTFYLE